MTDEKPYEELLEKTKLSSSGSSDTGGTPEVRLVVEVAAGTTVSGRYEVLHLVGRGGMGSLYAGKHTEIGRKVAIKFLHKDFRMNDESFLRFKQEATLAGTLNHNNICSVYDFGRLEDGTPYLVMDLLEGKPLSTLVKEEQRLSPERAVRIFVQICDALTNAHSKGIVHRDLKPSNVMVDTSTSIDSVKLLDFGIAKSLEGDGPQLTATHEAIGSPYYMSPEQCQAGEIDRTTDIYSLGCLMYECLTGRTPFKATSALQTMYSHVHTEPEKMSKAAPEANIPAALDAVVLKTLQKKPADRYQSADELKSALLKSIGLTADEAMHTPAPRAAVKDTLVLPRTGSGGNRKKNAGILIAAICAVAIGAVAMNWSNIETILDGRVPGEIYNGDDTRPYHWILKNVSNPQIHGVFLGQAHDTPRSKDNDLSIMGHATVRVTAEHPDVILVLGSHAQVEWNVVTAPGTRIQQVLTYSVYGHPKVNGVPPDKVKEIEPVSLFLSENEDLGQSSYFQKLDDSVAANEDGKRIYTFQYAQQIKEFAI